MHACKINHINYFIYYDSVVIDCHKASTLLISIKKTINIETNYILLASYI